MCVCQFFLASCGDTCDLCLIFEDKTCIMIVISFLFFTIAANGQTRVVVW